jgi:hypothetical protein
MRLPDGSALRSDDPDANSRLSRALGKPDPLWPLQPADRLDHYRRGLPTHDDLEQGCAPVCAQPGEPLPDRQPAARDLRVRDAAGTLLRCVSVAAAEHACWPTWRASPPARRSTCALSAEFSALYSRGRRRLSESSWPGQRLRISGVTPR